MESYKLKKKDYYRKLSSDGNRLFNACWNQYLKYLNGAIDNPTNDDEVLSWLDSIAGEKVNNSKSTFYIYGR